MQPARIYASNTRRRWPALKLTFTPLDRFGVNFRYIQILLLERQMGRLPTAELSIEERRNELVRGWLPMATRAAREAPGDADAAQEAAYGLLTVTIRREDPPEWRILRDAQVRVRNYLRGKRRRAGRWWQPTGDDERTVEDWASIAPTPEDCAAGLEALKATSDRLTEKQRRALVLTAVEGLSNKEAAHRVGLTDASSIQSAIARGRARLRKQTNPLDEILAKWLDGRVCATTREALEALGEPDTRAGQVRVGLCLRRLGWTPKILIMDDGSRKRFYMRDKQRVA